MSKITKLDPDDLIEVPQNEVEEFLDENEQVTFTEAEEAEFLELVQIGKLEKTIDLLGHKILIATLTLEEEIALGQTLKPYQDYPTQSHAFMACVAAAAIKQIDGKPLHEPFKPIGIAEDIRRKFNVIKKWYPTTVAYVYEQSKLLNEELAPIWSKLGKELS